MCLCVCAHARTHTHEHTFMGVEPQDPQRRAIPQESYFSSLPTGTLRSCSGTLRVKSCKDIGIVTPLTDGSRTPPARRLRLMGGTTLIWALNQPLTQLSGGLRGQSGGVCLSWTMQQDFVTLQAYSLPAFPWTYYFSQYSLNHPPTQQYAPCSMVQR